MLRLLVVPLLLVVVLAPASAGAWEVDGQTLKVPEAGCAIEAPSEDWRWQERQAPATDGSSRAFSCLRQKPPIREFLLIVQVRNGREVNQESMTMLADALGKWTLDDRFATFVQSVEHSYAPWEGSWQLRVRATHRESGRTLWLIAYVGASADFIYMLVALSDAPDESIDFGKYVQSFRLVKPDLPADPPPGNAVREAPGSQPAVEFFAPPTVVTSTGDGADEGSPESGTLLGVGLALGAFVAGFIVAAGLGGVVRLNPGILSLVAVAGVAGTRLAMASRAAHRSQSWSAVLEPLLPELGVAVVLLIIAATVIPRYRAPRVRPRNTPPAAAPPKPVRPGFDTATIQGATGFDATLGAAPAHPDDFRPPGMVGHIDDTGSVTPIEFEPQSPPRPGNADGDDIANAPGF